jgi:toxin ParE1/3/4
MSQIRISHQAEDDLVEIWLYIAHRNRRAADRLLASITAKYRLLADFPEMGSKYDELAPGLRGFVVGKYVIFYRPLPDGIEVARVLHGARDLPRTFRKLRGD